MTAPSAGPLAGILVADCGTVLARARQRRMPGRVATARLLGLNLGTALLAVGLPANLPGALLVGALLVGASVGNSLDLAAAALLGVRQVTAPTRG